MFVNNSRSLKILLVDDNPTSMFVHKKMLECFGHIVKCVDSEKEAIKNANENYDCILLDVSFSDASWLDIAASIRHQDGYHQYHTIIATTNYLMDDINCQCKKLGINKILTKPISPYALHEAVFSF